MVASPLTHARDRTARRRNRFFVWIAMAMLVAIALGFGRSFYLRPVFIDRPLPTYLVVHGAVMTGWYLLFLAQALLASNGRIDLHRRLGIAGVLLAAAVTATGVLVHLRVVPRMQALGEIGSAGDLSFALGFALAGLASLVPFVVLVALALAWRRRPAAHKRLMFWALVWTLGPAFTNSRPLGQFLDPLVAPHLPFFPADLLWLAALLAYDWTTLRRIHPVTWLGFLSLAAYFFVVMERVARNEVLQGWLRAWLGIAG